MGATLEQHIQLVYAHDRVEAVLDIQLLLVVLALRILHAEAAQDQLVEQHQSKYVMSKSYMSLTYG